MAKMLEDSLCTIGILEDDDLAHVGRSVLEVIKLDGPQKSARADAQRPKGHAPHEDYVVINIKPYAESNTHRSA